MKIIFFSSNPFSFWYDGADSIDGNGVASDIAEHELSHHIENVIRKLVSIVYFLVLIQLTHFSQNLPNTVMKRDSSPRNQVSSLLERIVSLLNERERLSSVLSGKMKRTEGGGGFIKKTVVPFPRLG